jgi:hypothetical protein
VLRPALDEAAHRQHERQDEKRRAEVPLGEPDRAQTEDEPADEEPVDGRDHEGNRQRDVEPGRPAAPLRWVGSLLPGGHTPGEEDARAGEPQCDQSREQHRFPRPEAGGDVTEPSTFRRRRQIGPGRRHVVLDLDDTPGQSGILAREPVREDHGNEQDGDHRARDHAAPDEAAERRPGGGKREPGEEDGASERGEERVIAGRQGLERERARGEAHVAPAGAALGGAMERQQHEREPLVAQDLDVPQLTDAEGCERVEQSRDRGRAGLAREPSHQPEHREPGQRERREPDEVVGEEHARAGKARGPHQRHEPEERLRVREGPAMRVKHVGVEEAEGRRLERVHVPREDPGGEERIAQIDDR